MALAPVPSQALPAAQHHCRLALMPPVTSGVGQKLFPGQGVASGGPRALRVGPKAAGFWSPSKQTKLLTNHGARRHSFSEDPQQRYIFTADGANGQVSTLLRATGEVLSTFGRTGRQAGQFKWVHNIAIDSKGNLYTAEVGFGRRVQKFKRLN